MTSLRKRMLEDLQIRNYSPNTVAAYIRRVAEFAKHFGKSPELLGPEEIREYQLYLIKEKTVSLSAYIQTVCGLRFLYSNTLHRSVSIDHIPLPRFWDFGVAPIFGVEPRASAQERPRSARSGLDIEQGRV